MKKMSKRICVIITIIISLTAIFFAVNIMYYKGVICTQEILPAYNNVLVSVGIVEEGEPQYKVFGFFITKNRVAVCGYPELVGKELIVRDVKGNQYKITEQNVYEHLLILETETPNKNDVRYLYSYAYDGDEVNAFIEGDFELCKYKVVDAYVDLGNYLTAILCEGNIEGNASTPAFDEHGRIIGLTVRSTDENKFYVYPAYEIISKIIADDVCDFLGVE